MFFICLTLLLASCQEPYEKAIDEYYQSHLHDPSSYELVKMVGPDSVTVTSAAVDMFLMQTDLTDEERTLGLTRYLLQLKSPSIVFDNPSTFNTSLPISRFCLNAM